MKRRIVAASCLAGFVLLHAAHAVARAWDRFEFIEWQPRTPAAYAGLRRLGVSAGALIADRDDPAADPVRRVTPLRASGLRYYVENIATDFYAPYHRWRPGLGVTALYDQTVARWRADPADPTVFWRQPSLVDAAWRTRIRARIEATVKAHAPFAPLFYDLADEGGVADLSSAWDFDRSPASLAAMRLWLRQQYGSLDALNAEWGTRYAAWEEAVPDTTTAAMRRSDANYASWSDFKAWMDASYADAIRAGTQAVHAADPDALAGVEGGQMAGWGGYDYARLAPAVDVMEIYPDAANVEIAQAMNPPLVTLATVHVGDPGAPLAIWRAALRGSRGVVLWDEGGGLVGDDGEPGPEAMTLAPVMAALRGPVGKALITSTPLPSAVSVLYSQASFRAQWMLDRGREGEAWMARGSDGENDDNAWRAAMRGVSGRLLRLGVRPSWLSDAQLGQGVPAGIKAVLLPHALALGEGALRALASFRARGGRVMADVAPGEFDEHLRRRAAPAPDVADIVPELWAASGMGPDGMSAVLAAAGVPPPVRVTEPDEASGQGLEIRVSRGSDGLIVTLLAASARSARLSLPQGSALYDLSTGERLGSSPEATVRLSADRPALLAVRTLPGR